MQSQTATECDDSYVYRCVRCGIYWSNNGEDHEKLRDMIKQNKIDVSSGYCPVCLRGQSLEKIRRAQKREGHRACYLREDGSCDQKACCYRSSCLEEEVEKWRKKVVLRESHIEEKS